MQKILRSANIGKFLVPAGAFLVLFSIFMFYVVTSSKGYIETDAVVTRAELHEEPKEEDIFAVFGNTRDKEKDIYVKYTAGDTEYEEFYGVFTGYKEGDRIKVGYDPDNPTELIQPGNLLHPIVILAVGLATIAAGIICFRIDFTDSESESNR